MKPKLTFLLSLTFLFLFGGSVYGQEEVKKEYWDNGKLKREIHYKNGKRDGLITYWYESGKKKYEKHLKDGKEDGLWTEWSPSGKKTFEGNFVDGNQR